MILPTATLSSTAIGIYIFAALLPCYWGQNLTIDKRIIGGKPIQIQRAPFMVNLREDGRFVCGGTLLTRKCVLTAAHCVAGVSTSRLTIQGAVTRLTQSGQMSNVRSVFVPRAYSRRTSNYDVAILRLAKPITNRHARTVKLARRALRPGTRVSVFGWGRSQEDGKFSKSLRAATVRVLPHASCKSRYRNVAVLTRSMFCASMPGVRDSCSGDSGGPVVYRGVQYGIVSWGVGCARRQYPGVNTHIHVVRPWIDSIAAQQC